MYVYQDVWAAMHLNTTIPGYLDVSNVPNPAAPIFVPRNGELCLGKESCIAAEVEVMKFAGGGTKAVPLWLAATYLIANILLNTLNWFWFAKMIETVRKRFTERKEKPGKETEVKRRPSMVLEVAGGLEQDDRMHGSMVADQVGKSTGMDGGVGAKRRLGA